MQTKKAKKTLLVISPAYQVMLILIGSLILSIFFYKQLGQFRFLDKKPDIYTITPDIYDKFGGFASAVNIGLEIANFETFDMTENKFVFSGIIWFKFMPGVTSLDTLEKFKFDRGKIISKLIFTHIYCKIKNFNSTDQ